MRATLALPETLWDEFTDWLRDSDESAGVLSAQVVSNGSAITLLGRALHRAPIDAYLERTPERIALRSSGWVPGVRDAARDDSIAVFVHSHPGGRPVFSELDDQVDNDLAPSFRELVGSSWYASVVIAGSVENPSIAARIVASDGSVTSVDSVRIVGSRLRVLNLASDSVVPALFDRQVRALGAEGQQVLQALRVGIIGAGGTGSPVAEQLIRLGVGTLVVVDDDVVTDSTVTRGYGSALSNVGKPKVEVLSALSAFIGLGTQVSAIRGNLRQRSVVNELGQCDVVFSCVDGHAARLILNRWAYAHLAPVIDVAVLISSDADAGVSIDGRVTWLAPGASCLLCRGRIDPTVAYAEHLDPVERRRLLAQGYVPDIDEPQPSVVPYTTMIASLGVAELLNRLFDLASSEPTEVLLRLGSREISLNRRPAREFCFCSDVTFWGRGLTEPYLDLTWAD